MNIPKDPSRGRSIWQYAYQLKTKKWIVRERVTIGKCIIIGAYCHRFGITFKMAPMSKENNELLEYGMVIASFLTSSLFSYSHK